MGSGGVLNGTLSLVFFPLLLARKIIDILAPCHFPALFNISMRLSLAIIKSDIIAEVFSLFFLFYFQMPALKDITQCSWVV